MSRKPSFANLRSNTPKPAESAPPPAPAANEPVAVSRPESRVGRKQIA